jgi:hypothetical protein
MPCGMTAILAYPHTVSSTSAGTVIRPLVGRSEMRRGNLIYVKVGRRRLISRHHLLQFLGEDSP